MTLAGWETLAVIAATIALLVLTNIGPDLIMVAALTTLITLGVFPKIETALAGFANEGMITVGVLFIIAAALRETGGLSWVAQHILGRPKSLTSAQTRLMVPTAIMSAFINNTPLVAMLLPVVLEWAKKLKISPSRVMMPLSFATILGGLTTLIGTSTNLIVYGLMLQTTGEKLGLFDVTLVGLPCAVAGIIYMLLTNRWLLPDRTPPISLDRDPREYTVEMLVEPNGAVAGKTVEEAGLRGLVGMFLMEIDRAGQPIVVVGPEERLQANDRLVFVGIVDSVLELQRFRGLRPATGQIFKLDAPRSHRCLIEAVVSNSCPLVGKSIREGRFRNVYNAVVVAVARNGVRINRKVGDIVVEPGDTLLLETRQNFAEQHRNSRDFFLVSRIEGSRPPPHERAWVAVAIMAAMVISAATEVLTMLNAALIAACLLILTRCLDGPTARRSIDWQILTVIGAALGLGKALEISGAASAIANYFISFAGTDPFLALVVIYGLTMVFTEVVTNNAAAALMFPIALATAQTLGVAHMPFAMAIMIAASCGFATPIGYQTHLMVYGPGGYRFSDFMRFGGPLNLVVYAVSMLVIPIAYPFHP